MFVREQLRDCVACTEDIRLPVVHGTTDGDGGDGVGTSDLSWHPQSECFACVIAAGARLPETQRMTTTTTVDGRVTES